MSMNASTLNDRQAAGVAWQDGPLLVLAGPGSGKTTVLTRRIARLIEESPGEHYRVLGLTFTNKAAVEMRKRIETLVAGAGARVLLTTFHSFAGDLLRQHGHLVGLKPDFTILSQEDERISVLDEALLTVAGTVDVRDYTGERLLPLINKLSENDVGEESVADAINALPEDRREIVGLVYNAYKRGLIATNSLDFPSLISVAVRVLREFNAVCKQMRRVYHYICVDEFQDTNLAQYSLLRCLVNEQSKNIFVVADDDQIIYQWNGASPERLAGIRHDFEMTVLQLPTNYRCPPSVIDIANKLIAYNTTRSPDKDRLLALKLPGAEPGLQLYRFNDFEEEVAWVAQDISKRSPLERERCVILARTRKTLDRAVEHLGKHGVVAYLASRKDEFASAPLRWLHAALRLANNPSDREQARRLSRAFHVLEGLQIDPSSITATAEAFEGSGLRAFADLAGARPEISQVTAEYLRKSLPLLTDRLDFRSFCAATFEWVEQMPLDMPDADERGSDFEEEKGVWKTLMEEIDAQFGNESVTLHLLLQEFDMRSKTTPQPKEAVPCFTIHASKGMEFGHVYLIAMVEDQLPSWSAVKKGQNSHEMQEERRNCFVAITRTEDSLTMTFSNRLFGWAKAPSRFLREMGFQV
jgi:DNA helicase-2/ATP-dependent DNA helicase PcrA